MKAKCAVAMTSFAALAFTPKPAAQARAKLPLSTHVLSGSYFAATVNAAAVAKHHGVKEFINMSQMTLSQMSIAESTASREPRKKEEKE